MKNIFLTIAAILGLIVSANAQTSVNAFATFDGISDSAEVDLAVGSYFRIGYFDGISDAQITAQGFSYDFLNSNFVEYGNATVGPLGSFGGTQAGHFNLDDAASNIDNATPVLGSPFVGQNIYFWAFNTDATGFGTINTNNTFNLATDQIYIGRSSEEFTAGGNVFPDSFNLAPGNITSLVGSFDATNAAPFGGGTFETTAVPEPGTVALMAAGLTALFVVRRRRNA